jgi:putative endonuclease
MARPPFDLPASGVEGRRGTMTNTFERGRSFEEIALGHLVRKGWTVLDRNVRFGRREIELVVRRGATVAFVEVKGRGGAGYGHPLEAITGRKRSEIEKVATWWVARNGEEGLEYRFDGLGVLRAEGGGFSVEHIENAWRLGE